MKTNYKTLSNVVLGVGVIGSLYCIYYKFSFNSLPKDGGESGSAAEEDSPLQPIPLSPSEGESGGAAEEDSPLQVIAYLAPSEGKMTDEHLLEMLQIFLTKNNVLTIEVNNQKLKIQSILDKNVLLEEQVEQHKLELREQNDAITKLILAVKSLEEDQANFAVDILLLEADQTEEEEMSNREFLRSDAISKLKALLGDAVLSKFYKEDTELVIESLLDDNSNDTSVIDRNLGAAEELGLPSNPQDLAGANVEGIDFPD